LSESENNQEFSLSEGSLFPKEKVLGSNPAPSTLLGSRLFSVIWDLKKKGYSERTLQGYAKRLKMLATNCDIDNPEDVSPYKMFSILRKSYS